MKNRRKVIVFVLWSMVVVLFSHPARGAELSLSPNPVSQGEVLYVSLTGNSICNPHMLEDNKSIPLTPRGNAFIGLVGVDISASPGKRSVHVEFKECGSGQKLELSKRYRVRKTDFRTQSLSIEDDDKVQLSEEALERVRRESKLIDRALSNISGIRSWSLPFAEAIPGMKPGRSFGSRRIINGEPRSPHSGEDYDADVGDPIHSVAGGTVSLTGNFFFSGGSVFIDHGGGLHSMYFHLSDIAVNEGKIVKKGQVIGEAGATGRVTGPHLHLGIRLREARVDPDVFYTEPQFVDR